MDVRIFEGTPPRQEGLGAPGGYISKRMIVVSASVDVVENDAAPIRLILDPKIKDALVQGTTSNGVVISRRRAPHVHAMFQFATLPVPIAFDAFLRSGEQEWRLGRVAGDARPAGTGYGTSSVLPDIDLSLTTATLILRPSEEAARQTPDLWEIFGEEIVIENVPVTVR